MKTQNIATIVKINPPRLASNIYLRKRLFKALDEARSRPVIWIAAPGGAGKTTLVTSYLKEKNLPCIWYQIDPGDGDIASFFHYMGIAAKKAAPYKKEPLPHLTPEYLAGLPAFTRNYFRELFSRVNQAVSKRSLRGARRGSNLNKGIATHPSGARNDRFVIVFDNYQEAPENSQLHEIMLNGLSEIPEGINVIIIGRLPLPSAMARLQVSETLSLLNWDDISLTLEESIGIGRLRTKGKGLNNEVLEALHKQTQGWVAGLILLLEQSECNITPEMLKDQLNHQIVFDYFAGEIFQRADKATQEFLLKTSFLPRITASVAALLTGRKHAADILNTLVRRNYFTIRHAGAEGVFEYHPLFRAFLENRMDHTLNNKELAELKNKAARLLIKADNIEDAVPLLQQTEDWQTLTSLILQQAPQLAQQGRLQTLAEWLQSLPDSVCEEEPWILYWLGVCGLPFSPSSARGHLEKAYNIFKAKGDPTGQMLAWCTIVETFTYEFADVAPLDHWIAELERFMEKNPFFSSPEIEARIAAGMFTALIFRQPQHPMLPEWTQRVEHIIASCPDMSTRLLLGLNLLLYYSWWTAEFEKGRHLIEMLKPLASKEDLAPLPRIAWHATEAIYYWITAENAAALHAVEEGLKLAEASGVHLWDFMLLAQGVWARVTANDLAGAEAALVRLRSILDPQRHLDVIQYYTLAFCIAQQRNDTHLMMEYAMASHRASQQAKMPWAECQVLIVLFFAHMAQGSKGSLKEMLCDLRNTAEGLASPSLVMDALAAEAHYTLQYQSRSEYLQALKKMFAFASRLNLLNGNLWARRPLLLFCMDALENSIEVEFVQKLIRKRSLIPEEPPLRLDNWPWQIRVYTLGRYNVIKGQKPLTLTPSSRKPLEFLSALIAFGGRMISKEMLTEALWPDAEGDVAQQSFETTLHRLRKLLGSDEALVLKDGRLTLDNRCCWVDCWAFERLIAQIEHLLGAADAKPDEVDKTAKKIFNLYHGHFLGRETDYSWALTLRERLRSRFLRYIRDMGRYWKGHEKIDEAVKYYIKGLEIDPISEGLYYGLMQCYIELGDFAEALSVYKRCCHTLNTLLNTAPSPKIEELYNSFRRNKTPQQEDKTSLQ